jgi:hypothetical protein
MRPLKPAPVLLEDARYCGRYVALKSFDDNTVVGSGKTPLAAIKRARAAGVEDPVLLFVPPKDVPWVY